MKNLPSHCNSETNSSYFGSFAAVVENKMIFLKHLAKPPSSCGVDSNLINKLDLPEPLLPQIRYIKGYLEWNIPSSSSCWLSNGWI